MENAEFSVSPASGDYWLCPRSCPSALVFGHLPNNIGRRVPLGSFVGVLPDVVKDIFLSHFDNLSSVQTGDLGRLIV
jgi:hypothetical protein